MPAAVIVGTVVVAGTLLFVGLHHRTHGVYNATQIALAFFLVVNILICFWEMALVFGRDRIRADYEATRETYRGRELRRVTEVFTRPIALSRVLSFEPWTMIWSSYSLFDEGYSDRRSFGYNIDVGNGFTMIIPSLLFALGMTFEIMPARVLGIVGVIIFWQMFYGTAVYYFQFFHCGRHRGHALRDLLLFVGFTNAIWLVFPLLGLYASIRLILDGSYALFV